MKKEFYDQISYIVSQIRNAGYDPLAQLTGYVTTMDERYITRKGNARNLIVGMDISLLKQFVSDFEP